MNRFIVFVIAFSFVSAIVVADNEIDNPEILIEYIDNAENLTDSAIDTAITAGEELYSTESELAKAQEEELTEAIGDMVSYFSKSITDMSNISEDIKNVGENTSETVRNNLVDNLLSYVEDSDMMKQQISRVMTLRNQFQDSILRQLYSLPISTEDAKKMENDLREQIKLRSDNLPEEVQNLIDLPQFPQQASNFIPQFNRN